MTMDYEIRRSLKRLFKEHVATLEQMPMLKLLRGHGIDQSHTAHRTRSVSGEWDGATRSRRASSEWSMRKMPHRGVSTRLSTVALSMAAFQFALDRELQHRETEGIITMAALAAMALISSTDAHQNVGAPSLVDALSLLLVCASMAPVFGTLTLSYANNTVNIITNIAYLIHLYSMDNRKDIAHAWASPVSLNAAFASTLLQASRLRSSALSFSFTLLATSLMVFVPAAPVTPELDFFLAGLAFLSSFVCFGLRRALMFLCVFFFVAVVGPRVLNRISSVKMHGPWDVLEVPEEDEDLE
jgi:hypothetical protein